MECRNSPVTKTPPRDLPTIPGVTSPTGDEPPTEASQNHLRSSPEDKPAGGEWLGMAGLSLQEAEERAWGWVVQGARLPRGAVQSSLSHTATCLTTEQPVTADLRPPDSGYLTDRETFLQTSSPKEKLQNIL